MEIEAIDGYKMNALAIFSFAIQYLKDHLLKTLKQQLARYCFYVTTRFSMGFVEFAKNMSERTLSVKNENK